LIRETNAVKNHILVAQPQKSLVAPIEVPILFLNLEVTEMMREILEIVMLLGLMGGLFFVKHEFEKDKRERLSDGKPEPRE
jgi:hypothetical protein